MATVAVVILNWNGREFLEKFLPDVVDFSHQVAEIIVADNASQDDSVSFLKAQFPQVKIIENDENGGFSKGYNDALSQVQSDYYVLLNSDIRVTPNWIEPVIEMMEKDKNIGAAQPKIRSFQEPGMFEYAGAAGGYIDQFGYPFCRGRIFQNIEKDNGQYDDAVELFWATGACMFVRADYYHQLGGLDNDFFAHMEEIDFCWRLKNNGFRIMYCPGSIVFHVGGGTLPKSSSSKTYLNFRNNAYLLYKNLPSGRLVQVFFVRLVLDGIASLKFLSEGCYKDSWAVFRAHLSFWKNFRKLKHERKSLRHHGVTGMYAASIVIDYFFRGKKKFTDLNPKKFS